jgi:uracil-DNA glycosylase family 4
MDGSTPDVPDAVNALDALDERIAGCRACPRLVAWREEVARTRRAAFADWTYWGRPVPGFGPPDASLLVVGLAPAAHGGNRTGRMFTGDRSGDVLYAALHEIGLASRPTAERIDDGLELYGVRITSPVHCAPPANKPTPSERDTCRPWLVQELTLLRPTLRSVVVLGAFGWQAALPAFAEAGWTVPRPRPPFAHGGHVRLDREDGSLDLFGCFHVSQRNTFTGKLTPDMLREVLRTAATSAGLPLAPTDAPQAGGPSADGAEGKGGAGRHGTRGQGRRGA